MALSLGMVEIWGVETEQHRHELLGFQTKVWVCLAEGWDGEKEKGQAVYLVFSNVSMAEIHPGTWRLNS